MKKIALLAVGSILILSLLQLATIIKVQALEETGCTRTVCPMPSQDLGLKD